MKGNKQEYDVENVDKWHSYVYSCVFVRQRAMYLSNASQQMVSNLWRAPPTPEATAGTKDPKWRSHNYQLSVGFISKKST